MKTLEAYQIHFDQKSKSNCFPEWNHYDNSNKLTEYFENSVISELISEGAHLDSEYFAVFSHDIARHVHFKEWINNTEKLAFNPDNLLRVVEENPDVDVFAFEKRRKNQNIIHQAEHYHPGFIRMITSIIREIGLMDEVPSKIDHIILFNHFVARSEIYEQYVTEVLNPAMEAMKGMDDLWQDAKYIKPMPEVLKNRFFRAFGKPYYPFHPFLLERLPSLFVQKHKLNVKQIF